MARTIRKHQQKSICEDYCFFWIKVQQQQNSEFHEHVDNSATYTEESLCPEVNA